jgi:acyl dehydratase
LSVERGRFLAPVRPGDTVKTEVEVISKKETSKTDRGLIVFRDHLLNQHGDTVYQIDKNTLIRRRPAAQQPD